MIDCLNSLDDDVVCWYFKNYLKLIAMLSPSRDNFPWIAYNTKW